MESKEISDNFISYFLFMIYDLYQINFKLFNSK